MTQKIEKDDIVTLACQALREGDMERVVELAKKMPMAPEVAISAKNAFGAEYLKDSGFNLSLAEEKYGKDWLNK